jgi:hypothetical protein
MSTRQEAIATGYFSTKKLFGSNKYFCGPDKLLLLVNLTLDSELIVAEIEDEALLGLDILMKGKGGPADIKLTEGLILLDGIR